MARGDKSGGVASDRALVNQAAARLDPAGVDPSPKKAKVSSKGRYVKGRSYEYELRDHFVKYGLGCRRVIQSGGGTEKDDLVLTCGWGEEMRLEAKRRGTLPAYLTQALDSGCGAVIFREDRGRSYALVTLERLTELCQ
jgi:hypothetical protein